MDEARPGYYAIIPADVRYDDRIPANAKLLYGEISALIGAEGYCYASNTYFANIYKMTVENIARLISKLEKAGHIKRVVIRDKTGQIVQRKLYLKASLPDIQEPEKDVNIDTAQRQGGIDKKINTPQQKNQEGIDKKIKETNTSITDKKKSKKEKPEPLTDEQMHDAVVAGIVKMAGDTWTKAEKNEIYRLTMALYDPNRVVQKSHPVRSQLSVDGTFSKLAKGGTPGAMIDMLNTAIIGGWQGVRVPDKIAQQETPVEERRYQCV